MIKNEVFRDGACIRSEQIDLEFSTLTIEENGILVLSRELTADERRRYGPQPLDATGALATLLAVEQVVSIEDAANAVGLTPTDLTNEAQGWAAAQSQ